MKVNIRRLTVVSLLLFCLATGLIAQVDTGVLSGTIFDNTDAVVPGVKVALTNIGTNYSLELETNAAGLYVSPPLPPGKYRIDVSLEGFQAAAKEIQLNLSERLAVDFTLQLGVVTETVTVEALGAVLQTETTTLSTLRTEREVKDLPNIGRIFTEVMRYSPGVAPPRTQSQGLAISETRGSTSQSVNGVSFRDNNFLIDGIQNNSNHQGFGVMNFPEIEALEQYRVETSAPDARFGRTGGTLNVGYKSGTNKFHGVLFEFVRNDNLDARNFFNKGAKAPLRQNQFGGTLGGPLGRKDGKTFFFISYEGRRIRRGTTFLRSVPTSAMKGGDFREVAGKNLIFDPLTTRPNPEGEGNIRDAFPNSLIPAARFSQPGHMILNRYPEPNLPGLAANLEHAPGVTGDTDQGTVKVDREFSAGSRGFVRYTQGRADYVNPRELGPEATPFTKRPAPTIQGVISYTHILNPRTIVQGRVGASRQDLASLVLSDGRNLSDEFGIPNVNVNEFTTGLPYIVVAGFPIIGDPPFNPAIIAMNNYQFSTNADMTRGNHSLKVGFDWVRRQTNIFQAPRPRSEYRFSTIYTSNPASRGGTGFGAAELLLGKPQRIVLNGVDGTRGLRRTDWAWYIQDDWKVTPRLTLNFGLRYDLSPHYPHYEVFDRFAQFDIDAATNVPVGEGRFDTRSGIEADRNNFGPRLGLAYRIRNTTVVRAAYGLYYFFMPFHLNESLGSNPPFYTNSTVDNDQGDFEGARGLSDGPLRTSDPDAPGQNRTGIHPDWVVPYTQQWNLAIQQQLPGQQQLTVAYVATKGTHVRQRANLNQALPGGGPITPRRRWPQHARVNIFQSRGNSIYHSLQANLVKRFAQGVHYQLAYTWSHLIDDGQVIGINNVPFNDITRLRGNGSTDIRHMVRSTFGYELPFGQGKRFLSNAHPVADKILGGWEVVGALSFYGGIPFSVIAARNSLNIGEGSYADRLADGNLSSGQQSLQRWFDVDAFTDPGFREWGNSGRNVIYGPGTKQMDFSAFKNIPVGEGKLLQFRAEFFNLTNTPQFNRPNFRLGNPRTGRITVAGAEVSLQRTQRLVQLGMKFIF